MRFLVEHGEPVGIIAAQSVGESITQILLKAIHSAGTGSAIATHVLPRVIALLGAKRPSAYTQSIFDAERSFGIEAARSAIVNELIDIFDKEGMTINPSHLFLIADAMTTSGRVEKIEKNIARKRSVIARAMFMDPVKELIGAALSGEVDNLSGVAENIAIGKQIRLGTGSVILDKGEDSAAQRHQDQLKSTFQEQSEELHYLGLTKRTPPALISSRNEAESTGTRHENKGLGSKIWKKDLKKVKSKSLRKAIERYKSRYSYLDDVERRFAYALPYLKLLWGKLSLHESVRTYSSGIYRQCIKRDITRGRSVRSMTAAAVCAACREMGIIKELEQVANVSNSPTHRIYANYTFIAGELGLENKDLKFAKTFATI